MSTPDLTIRPCEARSAPSRADCVSAFTLLELTIVLAIVVIVSAVAMPRYWSSLGRYRVDLAARRLAADLALAQSHARTTGQFRTVQISGTLPRYTLPEESSFDAATGAYSVDLGADPYVTTFGSISVTDGGKTITFDGYGQPAQGLTLTILAAGHQRTVHVDQSTGSIDVTNP